MEKLIFPVSVTQKEQLSGVLIFEFNFDANLRLPIPYSFILFQMFRTRVGDRFFYSLDDSASQFSQGNIGF